MIISKEIAEELIIFLATIPCGQNARKMPIGLIYAYLVMQLNEAEKEDNGQNHSDTTG